MKKIKEWLINNSPFIVLFSIIFFLLSLVAIKIIILAKNDALECGFDANPMLCVELKNKDKK